MNNEESIHLGIERENSIRRKKENIKKEIGKLIDKYHYLNESRPNDKKTFSYPLVVPTYGPEEIKEALDSLLSTYVTMGDKCKEFEKIFSTYVDMNYGLFVNSGSSANLIALSILKSPEIDNPIKNGDEIITPAVTWSTTVFPIYNIDAIPVFIDTNPNTMTLDVDQIEDAITSKTKAILPVHLLGNPCDMEKIMNIAREHNLYVIEDCCEAHGAIFNNKKIGSFGNLSTFSFFFSHHISTIEGGMVLSNNQSFIEIGKSIRAHGWVRERSDKENFITRYPKYDPRFLFVHRGYNLRPTEIQGAFGIHQMEKLDKFVSIRANAAKFLIDKLKKYEQYLILPKVLENSKQSWFGFSIIVKKKAPFTRREFITYLEDNNIETRPIMGGNFVRQPVLDSQEYRIINDLSNSQLIFENGIFIGLNHESTKNKLKKIIQILDKFFESKIE
ncbi:MAG: aminotransferase class I/II-fold pyridoxal phosphate-dependent enzyme [Candidatus Lokiarchaeota archaeon]|nr:aminotransferase class I/II-fold pyridoxal phosphate-dependent enzyme [Candidatus Lokiarchaeota archaeon]MBD3212950.1 aminotransferase class I/II-fold pyridoxal phosphate-dependent enzyme [Candidatus Lokiarchaeota archaeon]